MGMENMVSSVANGGGWGYPYNKGTAQYPNMSKLRDDEWVYINIYSTVRPSHQLHYWSSISILFPIDRINPHVSEVFCFSLFQVPDN